MQGPLIEQIFQTKGRQIFTVISTWVQPDNRNCGAYVEFNSENEEGLSKVREWIIQQKS